MSKSKWELLKQFPKESCGDVFVFGDGCPRRNFIYPLSYDKVIRYPLDEESTAETIQHKAERDGYKVISVFQTARFWCARVLCPGKLK